jgi:short-subunit dehydrogenase
MTTSRTTALITGASAGLGLEYAKIFAKDGHDLVLVARRRDKLEALARELAAAHGISATVIAADLADPAAPARIHDELEAAGTEIEFLVNNAGFGTNGPFATLDVRRELDLIEVNVRALVHLTRLFLPAMIARKRGRILNIGSTAGFMGGPYMADYYASKAYVLSFTEALAIELEGSGVTVTVSCPGPTATEFGAVAGNDKSTLFQHGVADAASVALHGYRAMRAGKVIALPGLRNKLIVALRLVPRAFAARVAGRFNRV